ncbi:MAG: preprotein translocase subunit SecE [Lachnospiraceae bacterium]
MSFIKSFGRTKQSSVKQTLAVAVVSILLGVLIAVVDFVVQYGIDFLVK